MSCTYKIPSTLTLTSVRFDVNERFAYKSNGIDIIVEFSNYSIITAGDCDGCFVTLDFTDAVELRDFVTLFYIPDDDR